MGSSILTLLICDQAFFLFFGERGKRKIRKSDGKLSNDNKLFSSPVVDKERRSDNRFGVAWLRRMRTVFQ